MNTYPHQKPGLFTAIAVITLTSGIVNLFWGFAASATILRTIIGVVCVPLTILPTILGIFEIIYAAKLFSAQPQPVRPSQTIAIFEITTLLYGNVFSMAVGILSLVFYNDAEVKDYFARLNRTPSEVEAPLEPATPPAPASLPDPEPAPAFEEPAAAPEESPAPQGPPAKPKRAPRKVAK